MIRALILGAVLCVLGGDLASVCAQGYPPPPLPPQQSCWTRVVTGMNGQPRLCTVCMTPSGPVEFCS